MKNQEQFAEGPAEQKKEALAMAESNQEMQKIFNQMQQLSREELIALIDNISGAKAIREAPEPFTEMTIDDAFTTIGNQRERLNTMLYNLFPFFDRADVDEKVMLDIRWDYDKIKIYLEIMQDCVNELERQEKRWERILHGIKQDEERRKAQQKEPYSLNKVSLSWTMPPDDLNLFDGYSMIHDKKNGERPQPAHRSLEQIAWLIERMKEDDIFEFGKGHVEDDLEHAVMELGIILKCNSRPFLPAGEAGELLRSLYEDCKSNCHDKQ